jgi:hypothetical protein
MRLLVFVAVLASSYFVEWIPNNAVQTAQGEWPWQGGW